MSKWMNTRFSSPSSDWWEQILTWAISKDIYHNEKESYRNPRTGVLDLLGSLLRPDVLEARTRGATRASMAQLIRSQRQPSSITTLHLFSPPPFWFPHNFSLCHAMWPVQMGVNWFTSFSSLSLSLPTQESSPQIIFSSLTVPKSLASWLVEPGPSPAPLTYDTMQTSCDLIPIQQKSLEGQLLEGSGYRSPKYYPSPSLRMFCHLLHSPLKAVGSSLHLLIWLMLFINEFYPKKCLKNYDLLG